MDAKAPVKVGPFARGGKSRVPTVAADHDFHPEATVTPVGISLPALDELFLPKVVEQICDMPRGLVLVTGVTGSGKSTTLAAIAGTSSPEGRSTAPRAPRVSTTRAGR